MPRKSRPSIERTSGDRGLPRKEKPLNCIPLRCNANPGKHCGCTEPCLETFKKRLPKTGNVPYCFDGRCDYPCAGSKMKYAQDCLEDDDDHHGDHKRQSIDNDCANMDSKCCDDKDKKKCDKKAKKKCECDNGKKNCDKGKRRKRKSKQCSSPNESPSPCFCCEHGVPYPSEENCCGDDDTDSGPPPLPQIIFPPQPEPATAPAPPQIIQREKPVILVNNTELCECESKWRMIERWQKNAKRKDEEAKYEKILKEKETEKQMRRERRAEKKRHEECLRMQQEIERSRVCEEEEWRIKRIEMEDRRMEQEFDMWLEDLRTEEANRRAQEVTTKQEDMRLMRQAHLAPRPTNGLTVPELEEIRRMLCLVEPGNNEIFEYIAVEPIIPPPPKVCCCPPPPLDLQALACSAQEALAEHHQMQQECQQYPLQQDIQQHESCAPQPHPESFPAITETPAQAPEPNDVSQKLSTMAEGEVAGTPEGVTATKLPEGQGIRISVGENFNKKARLRINMRQSKPCPCPCPSAGPPITIVSDERSKCEECDENPDFLRFQQQQPPIIPPELTQLISQLKGGGNDNANMNMNTPNSNVMSNMPANFNENNVGQSQNPCQSQPQQGQWPQMGGGGAPPSGYSYPYGQAQPQIINPYYSCPSPQQYYPCYR